MIHSLSDRLADKAHGNDLGGRVLRAVTPGPVPGHAFEPLPADVEANLVDLANGNAARFVGELRRMLGEVATVGEIRQLAFGPERTFGKRDLVHTQYFGDLGANPHVVELLRLHAERVGGIPSAEREGTSPVDGELKGWMMTSGSRFVEALPTQIDSSPHRHAEGPAEPDPSGTAEANARGVSGHQIGGLIGHSVPPIMLTLIALVVALANHTMLSPYTIAAQRDKVIDGVDIRITHYDYSKSEKNQLVRIFKLAEDWVVALADAGRAEDAVDAIESLAEPSDKVFFYKSIIKKSKNKKFVRGAINLAIRAAGELDTVNRSIAVSQVAGTALEVGLYDEAMTAERQVEDPEIRLQLFVSLAEATARAGLADETRRLVREALQLAEAKGSSDWILRGPSPGRRFVTLAEAVAQVGLADEARRLVRQAIVIAEAPGQAPDLGLVVATAGTAARVGLADEARRLVQQTLEMVEASGQARDLGLIVSLAEATARAGLADETRGLAKEALAEIERPNALDLPFTPGAAESPESRTREIREAFVTADRNTDPDAQSRAFLEVVGEVAKLKQSVEARRAAWKELVSAAEGVYQEVVAPARRMVDLGLTAEALAVARSKEPGARSRIIKAVATAAAETGLAEPALAAAALIEKTGEPSEETTQVAVALARAAARAGRLEEARRAARESLAMALRVRAVNTKDRALAAAAGVAAEVGLVDQALDVTGKIRFSDLRGRVLAAIESAVTEKGQLPRLMEVTEGIEADNAKFDALATMARLAADFKDPETSRRAARAISVNAVEKRSAALVDAAGALAKANRFYEARRLAEECLPGDKLDAYVAILEGYNRYRGSDR